ncbi:helix-turn-helix domain-containing protein [Virgibacillus senegalensis]|uniref:helix-turn-helix domain-containing protein n=1 Tax=Virgibacillus senegalensis TaxID=1499679 RepID=UPI00069CD21C|nr:helix-turn-helix domain-containing protein [Virgibacillus senegalensis]
MKRFILFTKTGVEKWPLQLFPSEEEEIKQPLEDLNGVKDAIIKNGGLYYVNTNKQNPSRQFIYRSQISAIYGPYNIPGKENLTLDQVMSLNEAASRWKSIRSVDTIRKAILANRFYDWEVRKSESVWLVTYAGLVRLFGPEDHMETDEACILKVQEPKNPKFEEIKKGKVEWIDLLEDKESSMEKND